MEAICKYLKIEIDQRMLHTGLGDAILTAKLIKKICEKYQNSSINNINAEKKISENPCVNRNVSSQDTCVGLNPPERLGNGIDSSGILKEAFDTNNTLHALLNKKIQKSLLI